MSTENNNQERIRIPNEAAEQKQDFYFWNGGCTKEEYDQVKAEAERGYYLDELTMLEVEELGYSNPHERFPGATFREDEQDDSQYWDQREEQEAATEKLAEFNAQRLEEEDPIDF